MAYYIEITIAQRIISGPDSDLTYLHVHQEKFP